MVQRIRMAARIERDRRTPVSIGVPVRARPSVRACLRVPTRAPALVASECVCVGARENTRHFHATFRVLRATCNAQH